MQGSASPPAAQHREADGLRSYGSHHAAVGANGVSEPSAREGNHHPPVAEQPKLKVRLSGYGNSRSREPSPNASIKTTSKLARSPTAAASPAAVVISSVNGYKEDDAGGSVGRDQHMQDIEAHYRSNGHQEETNLAGLQEQPLSEEERQLSLARDAEQLARDLAELPSIARQHLVPFHEIVRRTVARSYDELQSIVEVLPSQSDYERKGTIIQYVISTRRQIIKLLVLLRWAKDNNQDTEKAINLIAFLQRQNYQLERAVDALKGVETLLAGARVRNYDLQTATDILTTGTYSTLPTLFHDAFIPPPKLSSSDVLHLLQDLESVIRYRLQLREHIPPQMLRKPYRIHDGRVTFHCPGYFKAAFTLGGDALTDQWYLVDFAFDFKSRESQVKPSSVMREHIIQVCNTKLAEAARSGTQAATSDHSIPSSAFSQVYSVLRNLCLNYQLELIHYQAIQVNSTPTIWQDMLSITLAKDRASLDIKHRKVDDPPFTRHSAPEQRFEEIIRFSLPQQQEAQRTLDHKPLASRALRLASRLAAVKSSSLDNVAEAPSTAQADNSERSQNLPLHAVYSRQPVYIDGRGRRIAPPQHLKLDMSKTEYLITLYEDENTLRRLRDLDDILGECFMSQRRPDAVLEPVTR